MSLPSHAVSQVPEETQRVACAAFPRSTLSMQIADTLGSISQGLST
jgi:hypothetical protein